MIDDKSVKQREKLIDRGVVNLPNDLVSLVDHLGGGEVVGGQVGVLAGGPLDAGELLLGAGHEHHEAHASGHVGGGHGNTLGREETKAENEGLEDQEDQEVGEVEGEDLGGGGGSGQELQGFLDNWHLVRCRWSAGTGTSNDSG